MTEATSPAPKKKLAIVLDNDLVVRHFVFSDAFREVEKRHDVVFLLPQKGWKRLTADIDDILPGKKRAHVSLPDARQYWWKQLMLATQIRLRPGKAARELRKLVTTYTGWKASLIFTIWGLPGLFSLYRKRVLGKLAESPATEFRHWLETEKPDMILYPSTFEGYFLNDAVALGKELGIQTVVLMNSWDNPSMKNAMTGTPDQVVLWGEQTARHAEDYMGVDRENIHILGAAQFDLYRHPPATGKQDFCAVEGISDDETIVLYAGSSRNVNEYGHLQLLEKAIDDGRLPPVKLLYRPHPWGAGGSNGNKIFDHDWKHVIIESSMRDYMESVARGRPPGSMLTANYSRTHDLLSAVDVVISPMSTILLESLLHHKPAMCFLPIDENSVSMNKRVGLVHFQDLFQSPILDVCWGTTNLVAHTAALLKRRDEPQFVSQIEEQIPFFVQLPDKEYPDALADYVESRLGMGKPVQKG